MRDITQHISPLIESMFPSFYHEEGTNFIAFVKAYYEWLETLYQTLTLEDSTGFDVGDTITQVLDNGETVSGIVISKDGDQIIVQTNSVEQFRCIMLCGVLQDLVSSSGSITSILYSTNSNAIYHSRNLMNYRDVDTTIDRFIVNFKEKYLKNIQFDTATNKKLLIKNSLDLYRSKGSERSIDLFFKLIYGIDVDVYYPGDDIFKLSDGTWYLPKYVEITNTSSAVGLVGKQITGSSSGAVAFVEKYIKRRIGSTYVGIMYLTNILGEFSVGEYLYVDTILSDSPKILGSLEFITVETSESGFTVGDLVQVVTPTGVNGLARVTKTTEQSGVVDFTFIDGGYGYTTNAASYVAASLLSCSNVVPANSIYQISIANSGSGYSNSNILNVTSYSGVNARALIATSNTGAITDVTVTYGGYGFINSSPQFSFSNTAGAGALFSANLTTIADYFKPLDTINQNIAEINFNSASADFAIGDTLFSYSANQIGRGVVLAVNQTASANNGNVTVNIIEGTISNTNTLNTSGNTKYCIVNNSITSTKTAKIIDKSLSGYFTYTVPAIFSVGEEVYQMSLDGINDSSNATITSSVVDSVEVNVGIENIKGVISPNQPIIGRTSGLTANVNSVGLSLSVSNTSADFTIGQFVNLGGTTGFVESVSVGSGASFNVSGITNIETYRYNTDFLSANNDGYIAANSSPISSKPFTSLFLNEYAYGLPGSNQANLTSIAYAALSFSNVNIGTVSGISGISPGNDYNIDPKTLIIEPVIYGLKKYDYDLVLSNSSASFVTGETVNQLQTYSVTNLTVANSNGFIIGEKLYQSAANGVVDTISNSSYIVLRDVSGTFNNTNTLLSYITSANTTVSNVSSGNSSVNVYGEVIDYSGNTLSVARLFLGRDFTSNVNIVGELSGASATVADVGYIISDDPSGINADVDTMVFTANSAASELQIVDSGFGYIDGAATFTSNTGGGTATIQVDGQGVGSGYYKSTKGFSSSNKYLYDGEYYQEYSYDIMSKLPLEKYADMFKQVMHTAGTKYFSSVHIDSDISTNISFVESYLEIN